MHYWGERLPQCLLLRLAERSGIVYQLLCVLDALDDLIAEPGPKIRIVLGQALRPIGIVTPDVDERATCCQAPTPRMISRQLLATHAPNRMLDAPMGRRRHGRGLAPPYMIRPSLHEKWSSGT